MFLSKHVKYPKGVQIQNIKDILEKKSKISKGHPEFTLPV